MEVSVEHLTALEQLQRLASRGDRRAKRQILRVVTGARADVALRRNAIAIYYSVSRSRFRARREISALLPPAERYLVHQTF
jgi:hypothetical protein